MKKRTVFRRAGFTLAEMLVVVLIVAVLASLAAPSYVKSLEKARATEALPVLQALDEAVYTFAAEKGRCPERWSQILVEVPGTVDETHLSVKGKYFTYKLFSSGVNIPGTPCEGTLAQKTGKTVYKIWNPYAIVSGAGTINQNHSFACSGETDKAKAICKTLGLAIEPEPESEEE